MPRRGFTLPELLVALVLVGLLAGLTLPRLTRLRDRARVRSATLDAVTTLAVARQAAIARGRRTIVRIDVERGRLVVLDGADTVVRRELGAEHGVRLSATRRETSYLPMGLGYGAANLSLVIARGSARDTVVVSRLGRVRH